MGELFRSNLSISFSYPQEFPSQPCLMTPEGNSPRILHWFPIFTWLKPMKPLINNGLLPLLSHYISLLLSRCYPMVIPLNHINHSTDPLEAITIPLIFSLYPNRNPAYSSMIFPTQNLCLVWRFPCCGM